jgi:hypothetical protein
MNSGKAMALKSALPSSRPRATELPSAPRQQVVVRAPGSDAPAAIEGAFRLRLPTLQGLGFRPEFDSVPVVSHPENESCLDNDPFPLSEVRARVAPRDAAPPVPSASPASKLRLRPTVVLEAEDSLAKRYLDEAERLLASGVFDRGISD